jgi:hypothetical protein
MKVRPGREGRIRAPRVEKVENNFGLKKKAVPEVVGEVRVDGREQSDEVVLCHHHCSLCRVGPLYLWGHKLHGQLLREKILSAL